MTIDEAIVHAREVTEKKRRKAKLSPKDSVNVHIKSDCLQCAQEHEQLAKWLEELKQYRAIGTPEECRAAVEKQTARNPIDSNMESGIFRKRKIFTCSRCGNACLEMMMNERQNTNYCWDCGQKLDWSDEE